MGGRSAGSVLRSLRRLGGGGAFALCARGDGDRLQGSLQPDPAPLGVFWRYAGSVLRSLRRLGGGLGFRAVREGFCYSPPRLAADRSRSARRIVVIAFNARFGPVSLPLRVGWVFGAADVRRLRGSWGCCWGRCLARRRFGRINCATWRLLIVPRSGPGDLTRVLLLLARALARVLARARVRRRCRRLIRRIGRRRGSG